jgi:carbamate kinase
MIACPGDLRISPRHHDAGWWAAVGLAEGLRRADPGLEVAPIVLRPVVSGDGGADDEPTGFLPLRAAVSLLEQGVCVVALVCGTQPAALDAHGRPRRVGGRVPDDAAAASLAIAVDADALLLLTDVDAVYRDFGTARAAPLRRLVAHEAERLARDGSVHGDSMAPKLRAASRFARHGGFAAITATERAGEAMHRTAGTRVVPDGGTAATGRRASTVAGRS